MIGRGASTTGASAAALNLSEADLRLLARNGFEAAFMPEVEKEKSLAGFERGSVP